MTSTFILLGMAVWWGIHLARKRLKSTRIGPPILHAPNESPKRRPGYVYVLWDKNRPELVKIVGSRKELITPLDKLYILTCPNYEDQLRKLYQELREVRVASYWYDKDGTDAYFDHVAPVQ